MDAYEDVPAWEKKILPLVLPFMVEAENFSDHHRSIHTTLLALCYSDMFQPSKGQPQGVQLTISTARSTKYVPDAKL